MFFKHYYMIRLQRITLFFLFSSAILFTYSCKSANNDIIPDVYVDFTIDLLDPEFISLYLINSSATIDASTNNWGNRAAGYGNNGIIIFRGPDEYYAFDRTCPHDFSESGLAPKINIAEHFFAVCPECSTKYSLSRFGTPVSGPGKFPLKSYKTSFDGERFIRVWNK